MKKDLKFTYIINANKSKDLVLIYLALIFKT